MRWWLGPRKKYTSYSLYCFWKPKDIKCIQIRTRQQQHLEKYAVLGNMGPSLEETREEDHAPKPLCPLIIPLYKTEEDSLV